MKVAQINSVAHGSTGRIMLEIAETARLQDSEVHTFSGARRTALPVGHHYIGSVAENFINRTLSVFSGISDMWTQKGTRELLKQLDQLKPDVIHLHNLHGWYLNVPVLVNYVKEHNIPVIWTLHDCWGFTGQCSHFTVEKCQKWKTGCYSCPRYRLYPYTFVDRTSTMWTLKKEWFSDIARMTIVTPSYWLAEFVKESFLKDYPVKVIHNGINLSVFKPTGNNFRERYGVPEDRFILLGVASGWGERKGLDVFIELAKLLEREKYQIVLIGTNKKIDKTLPENIISIHRTNNQQELAQIYSAADLFINPTREDNYPTVNMEALACGTPVVTFRTGGSPEILDEKCGSIVECDDICGLQEEICRICTRKAYRREDCLIRAKQFDMNQCIHEYISLYKEVEN